MYKPGAFEQIGSLEPNELVVKIPGTTLKMPYSDGKVFADSNSLVGYVALGIEDLVAESVPHPSDTTKSRKELYPWVDMGESAKELAEKLNDSSEREEILGKLKSSKLYLAYSIFYGPSDKFEALTIPGTAVGEMKAAIDMRNFHGLNVGFYDMLSVIELNEEDSLKSVLAVHQNVLAGLEPEWQQAMRKTLEDEVFQLISKANEIYNNSLFLFR